MEVHRLPAEAERGAAAGVGPGPGAVVGVAVAQHHGVPAARGRGVGGQHTGGVQNPRGEVVSATFWMTMVGAPICPASAVIAGLPSMATRYFPSLADQVKVNEAAGMVAVRLLVGTPPAGAAPKRKPMSLAWAESGKSCRMPEGFT